MEIEECQEIKDIAKKLKEKYYLYIGYVNLDSIFFAKLTGEKPKKANILNVSGIKSAWVKYVLQRMSSEYVYCIYVWEEYWDNIYDSLQEWMIFDALLRIDQSCEGELREPDVCEWGFIVEYIGPYWRRREDLPSLLKSKNPLPIPLPFGSSDN